MSLNPLLPLYTHPMWNLNKNKREAFVDVMSDINDWTLSNPDINIYVDDRNLKSGIESSISFRSDLGDLLIGSDRSTGQVTIWYRPQPWFDHQTPPISKIEPKFEIVKNVIEEWVKSTLDKSERFNERFKKSSLDDIHEILYEIKDNSLVHTVITNHDIEKCRVLVNIVINSLDLNEMSIRECSDLFRSIDDFSKRTQSMFGYEYKIFKETGDPRYVSCDFIKIYLS